MGWRAMRTSDLPAVRQLESAFYVHHPERASIAPERLALAPEWCFVLELEGGFAGYAIAHPWGGALPPGLDCLLGGLPPSCDALHLHDMVLSEATRGQGHASGLLGIMRERAVAAGLQRITLVAVGEASNYWTRQGFTPDPDAERAAFVTRSYGDGQPMLLSLPTAEASRD